MTQQTFDNVDALLNRLRKSAAGEPKTSHPIGDVDDNMQDASTGARFKENTEQVKENVGPGAVESTEENKGGTASSDSDNIGVQQSSSGEDPGGETKTKTSLSDPGTTHPAKIDVKMASALLREFKQTGDALVAALTKSAAASCSEPPATKSKNQPNNVLTSNPNAPVEEPHVAQPAAVIDKTASEAAAAGHAAAEAVAAVADADLEKFAAQQSYRVLKQACADADLVIQAIAVMQKAAEHPGASPVASADPSMGGDPSMAAGAPGQGAGGQMDPQQLAELLAMLQSQGGAPAAGGGPEPDGDEGAGGPGDADGDEMSPEDLAMLQQILAEQGQDPAAFQQKAAAALMKTKSGGDKSAADKKAAARRAKMEVLVREVMRN